MTLSEYIKKLQALENKGYGELEVIYSVDEEGNAFYSVYHSPSVGVFHDGMFYSREEDKKFLKEDEGIEKNDNAICVN